MSAAWRNCFGILALAFALHNINICFGIQVYPEKVYNNYAIERRNDTIIGADSELSASERNRRLIPYMAFYLPSPEFPINQQYAVQKSHKPHQHHPQHQQQASGDYLLQAPPAPPPVRIPIPPTYMQHLKAATSANAELQQQYAASVHTSPHHQPQHVHYQHSAPGPDIYGNTDNFKEHNNKPQVVHVLAPVATPTQNKGGFISYKQQHQQHSILGPHKLKTVQHFPPLPPPQQELLPAPAPSHTSLHIPPLYHRQRAKQSKINLTPFTAENTLPGHFVPIVYTPVSTSNNNKHNEENNDSDNVQHNNNQQHQQIAIGIEEQSSHKNSHQQQQQQQIVLADYGLQQQQQQSHQQQAVEEEPLHQLQHHHPHQHSPKYNIAPPVPVLASNPTSSAINYHVFNEPSLSSSPTLPQQHSEPVYTSSSSSSSSFDTATQRFKQRQPPLLPPPSTYHTSSKHENYFHFDTHAAVNNEHAMTPQEKYVYFLQQRMRYQKQKQQQKHDGLSKEQYLQRPTPVVYVTSTTTHRPTTTAEQNADVDETKKVIDDVESNNVPPPTTHYAQHSPIGHAVYARPELPLPPNHHSKLLQPQQQQVLHIPLRAIIDNLNEQQQQLHQLHQKQQHDEPKRLMPSIQHPQQEYVVKAGIGPPQPLQQQQQQQYVVDYLIDEPKQALDETHADNQPQRRPHPAHQPAIYANLRPTLGPPQPAYIIVTTAAPQHNHDHQQQHHFVATTQRPATLYKQQPTLRLQPVESYEPSSPPPTRRPYPTTVVAQSTPSTPSKTIEITPKYSFKPPPGGGGSSNYKDVAKPTIVAAAGRPIKLRPAQKYNNIAATHPTVEPTTFDINQLPDIRSSSLADILHKLQASNHLPHTLTPANIDNSIKTLVGILQNLKQTQNLAHSPAQHHDDPVVAPAPPPQQDYKYTEQIIVGGNAVDTVGSVGVKKYKPNKHPGPSNGRAGIDYPNYASIPQTSFDCGEQRYKGFFGDPETNCQVWHYCDLNGGKASFLCPNGTIFSQIALTCDWWFNVKCSTTAQLYVLNERLYKYILPFTPKFPEDYSGPIVDKYLAMKFQEMEEKMRLEKEKKAKEAAVVVAEVANADDAESATENEHTENYTEQETTSVATTATAMATATTTTKNIKHSVNSQVGEQSSERNLLIDDEIDDISERGSYDKYHPSTPTTIDTDVAITTTAEGTPQQDVENLPLSLKPIVVSSTPSSFDESDEHNDEDKLQSLRDTLHEVRNVKPTRETTKVSVEKLEVIEIKTDGSTGHLTHDVEDNYDVANGRSSSSSSSSAEQAK